MDYKTQVKMCQNYLEGLWACPVSQSNTRESLTAARANLAKELYYMELLARLPNDEPESGFTRLPFCNECDSIAQRGDGSVIHRCNCSKRDK